MVQLFRKHIYGNAMTVYRRYGVQRCSLKWPPLECGGDLDTQNEPVSTPNSTLGHVRGGHFSEHHYCTYLLLGMF